MNANHRNSRSSMALARRATVCAAMAMAMAMAPSGATATVPQDVTFVSGGISTDAVDHLRAIQNDFNLKMVFALSSGEYLANVRVQVVDPSSRNVVLDTLSDGPWLLARLPAGNYEVSVTYGGLSERRVVAVAPTSLKTLDFRWPAE